MGTSRKRKADTELPPDDTVSMDEAESPGPSPQLMAPHLMGPQQRGRMSGTPESVPEGERRAWRDCTTAEEFFDRAKWCPDDKQSFLGQQPPEPGPSTSVEQRAFLRSFLLTLAKRHVTLIKEQLSQEQVSQFGNIDWSAVFPDGVTDESHEDNLITAWIHINRQKKNLIRVQDFTHSDYKAFASALRAVIPSQRRQQRHESRTIASKAFQSEPRTRSGKLPSQAVYEELSKYCTQYDDTEYVAPYTSIVGPSGIGKSYAVQSLAIRHGLYVSYTSFASELAYPSRSPVTDSFPLSKDSGEDQDQQLERLAEFFMAFIFLSLEDVRILRKLHVSPKEHFLRQINSEDENEGDCFRQELKDYVANFWKVFAAAQKNGDQTDLESVLQEREAALRTTFSGSLMKDDSRPPDQGAGNKNNCPTVVCIDEARALLQYGPVPFRAFRRALRDIWHWIDNRGKEYPRVFGLVLDTTSKISNFSPAPVHDPSQKVASVGFKKKLFPPIYMLDSRDVFVVDETERALFEKSDDVRYNTQQTEKLLSFGRPLWGAMLNDMPVKPEHSPRTERIRYVLGLAWQKTQGSEAEQSTRCLALLSYRINFYVHRHEWAERLVSGWMRYITWIDDDREMLYTVQSSEPILAYTAAKRMREPETRNKIIEEFSTQVQRGTISVRDTGEIVAALLLLFAADAVQFHEGSVQWPKPMMLSEFIESFLGHVIVKQIASCVDERVDMKAMWRKGEVFFNHLVRLTCPPDSKTLYQAYRRGAALFLLCNSPGADILIPVHLPGQDQMLCFLIQVKNRRSDALTPSIKMEALSDLETAATAVPTQGPHLAMMMCLRSNQSALTTANPCILHPTRIEGHSSRSTRRQSTTASGAPETAEYLWNDSKRVVIIALGLNQTIYPALRQDGDKAALTVSRLTRLLACRPMTITPENESHREYLAQLDRL